MRSNYGLVHIAIQITALTVTVLMIIGCTMDVTEDPKLCGGYTKGDSYLLLHDVAITEDGALSAIQTDVDHYRSVSSAKAGVIISGTTLKITHVLYRHHPENGDSIYPWAVVQSGCWQGREVNLRWLSRDIRELRRGAFILEPDPNYLKGVTRKEEGTSPVTSNF